MVAPCGSALSLEPPAIVSFASLATLAASAERLALVLSARAAWAASYPTRVPLASGLEENAPELVAMRVVKALAYILASGDTSSAQTTARQMTALNSFIGANGVIVRRLESSAGDFGTIGLEA
jgi:hypothetical protein